MNPMSHSSDTSTAPDLLYRIHSTKLLMPTGRVARCHQTNPMTTAPAVTPTTFIALHIARPRTYLA
eukprot:UN00077